MFKATCIASMAARRAPFVQRRLESTYQPPTSQKSNAHRDFYKHNGRPILKTFLIAIFTYEVLYWSWLKLESIEVKHDKEVEMKTLDDEVRREVWIRAKPSA